MEIILNAFKGNHLVYYLIRRLFLIGITQLGIIGAAYSQKEGNIGIFGWGVGLNFNIEPPEVFLIPNDYYSSYEGVATISDRNGNLLFYTNGSKVWNNRHLIMSNGAFINGNDPKCEESTTQVVIAPIPKDPFLYYIFTAGCQGGDLAYSLVDMRLDEGLGAVVFKDSIIYENTTEKLCMVKNAGGDGLWLITHEYGTNIFRTFRISENGLDLSSINSAVGIVHQVNTENDNGNIQQGTNAMGYMKISKDGKRLACSIAGEMNVLELYNFDSATGYVNNPVRLLDAPGNGKCYGVEFSPDGTKIYISLIDKHQIYQYDLMAGETDDIISSGSLISTLGTAALQLGPNGEIYVGSINSSYLDVIPNPNEKGILCNYQEKAIYLKGKGNALGLPEFIYDIVPPDIIYSHWCNGDTVQFDLYKASNIKSIEWSFGDPESGTENTSTDIAPVHVFTKAGNYNVRAIVTLDLANNNILTYEKTVTIFEVPHVDLGEDTIICNGAAVVLYTPDLPAGVGHLWQGGDPSPSYIADKPGKYWMKVFNPYCFSYDTINITPRDRPFFELPDTILCYNATLPVSLNIPYANFTWNDGVTGGSRNITGPSTYSVTGKNSCGEHADTFTLYKIPQINLELGNDTTICHDGKINLNVHSDSSVYKWNDGSSSDYYTIKEGGTYWVEVSNRCERASDTLRVKMFSLRDVFLPNLITPNGDNLNETFIVDAPLEGSAISIVNRWGDRVYFSKHYQNEWPEERAEPGVYYYHLEERCSGDEFKGWVNVISGDEE